MNFVNCTAETFKEIFGKEGLSYAETQLEYWEANLPYYPEQGVRIIVAKEGDYPEIDSGTGCPQAFVSHLDPETNKISYESNHPLGLVVYPEVMAEQHRGQALLEYHLNMSTLIHELTHVKQVCEGRLISHGFLDMTWEGERLQIEMDGYLAYPWEKEACMAQLVFLTRGNMEAAEAAYRIMVDSSKGLKL